ncbi:MAG: DUF192 domain-containing protein [Candidatus Woesearchaeota archaeon]|nr:DUF192 domain-containing protein [Candidatus Woesearchaeota archaeon]
MIINKTKRRIIVNKHKIVKSIFLKVKGLMFTRKNADFGLIFEFKSEKTRPLHMFFVFYTIDVIFLDSKKRVAEIKRNLKPFSVYTPKNRSKYIIELPKGKAKYCNIGDIIKFK